MSWLDLAALDMLSDNDDGCLGCAGILVLLAVVILAVIGFVAVSRDQAAQNQTVPAMYVGTWAGRVSGQPGEWEDLTPPASGPISVVIPSGMTMNNGTAVVSGPGSRCAEDWSVDNIKSNSVSFDSSITKGSDTVCGDVDTFESVVVVTIRTHNSLNVEWTDEGGDIIGDAILYRR